MRSSLAFFALIALACGGSPPAGAPQVAISAGPLELTNQPAATFTFAATPADAQTECRLDEAAWAACASPLALTVADGTHTLEIQAVSAEGARSPTPARWSWTVDSAPPQTTLDTGPSDTTDQTSATFTFHSSEEGGGFSCALDSAAPSPCQSGLTLDGLSVGPHTFTVAAFDVALNVDVTPASWSWTVEAPRSGTPLRVMAANLTSGDHQSYDDAASGGSGCANPASAYGTGEGKRIFQGLHPDVVAIQELNALGCDGTNSEANIRAFVDDAFGAGFFYYREPYTAAGNLPNGIISRYPIVASGNWEDTVQTQPNRGFAWAQIDVPGPTDLYVISVHLLTSSEANRAAEADLLLADLQAHFPAGAWVVLAGDFNTHARDETAIAHLASAFVTAGPYPADQNGNDATNNSTPRLYPDDWVLATPGLDALRTPVQLGSSTYPDGLVFDSRVYTPLSEASPVLLTDSDSGTGMQHMAVVRDFLLP